jgi:hypothetical protein
MSLDVPVGAKRPSQSENESDGSPNSRKVGISVACVKRLSLVSAYALMLPACINGNESDGTKDRSI